MLFKSLIFYISDRDRKKKKVNSNNQELRATGVGNLINTIDNNYSQNK